MTTRRFRRKIRSVSRGFREARMVGQALKSRHHPVLAHLVATRRCNLSCTYCNEFDDFSRPVLTEDLLRRIDKLAELGTAAIHLSGGEPLLHPDLDVILSHIGKRGAFSGVLTNGYLLTRQRIEAFNRIGLDHLQISVDNVKPDAVSMKSLKVLDQKLQWLAEYAEFHVSINSVLGGSLHNPKDAVEVARRVQELGLQGTVGILHDGSGQVQPLNPEQRQAYQQIIGLRKQTFVTFAYYNQFQKNLVEGSPNQWHCRAGSRYLYVCEDGLVHYCSQQRGYPAIPLERYRREDLDREYYTQKSCAPFCTISCVHRVSMIDSVRQNPTEAIAQFFPAKDGQQRPEMPMPVRALMWLFLPENQDAKRRLLKKAAMKMLGVS